MAFAIINADDFGINSSVNEAIALCFAEGIITSTTLMVNMPASVEAVSLAKRQGFYDKVGIHLNLTAGEPLTYSIRGFNKICDEKGYFHAHFHQKTVTRFFLGAAERKAMTAEIDAQISRYLSYKLPLLHLDSHHHVHTDPVVWICLENLALKYGFRSVRLSRDIYDGVSASGFNKVYKRLFNSRLKTKIPFVTDHFGSFLDFKESYASLGENDLVEVMVHPMFSEDGILMDTHTPMNEIKEFLLKNKVKLVSY